MASLAPAEAASIFATLETDNASIVADAITAAIAMPPAYAATVAPMISRAARAGVLWVYSKDASELCVKLGEGGQIRASLDLADAVFSPKIERADAIKSQRDLYLYREGLSEVVPVLATRAGAELAIKACTWLQRIIELTERTDPDSGDDCSCVWRPAIEDHEQNHEHQLSAMMVGFVREAFETAIRASQLTLAQALAVLDGFAFLIFKRLRIHLISEFAEQSPELLRQIAMDRDVFMSHWFKHEYAMLVGKRFDLLTDGEKAQWFEWIDRGPDMRNFDAGFRSWHQREPTEEDRTGRIEYWKFEKLHLIRNYLPANRLECYKRMLAAHGEPRLADMNIRSGPMRFGSQSPFEVEQLSAQTFAHAVEMVASWNGDRNALEGPDIEGLASTFEQYVATNPAAFSAEAELLKGKPAIFVRGFIQKISDAISGGQVVDIAPVLELCLWVIQRPVNERTTTQDDPHAGMVDRDWQWTRDAIARLIETICKAKHDDASVYPLKPHRERLWTLLSSLCHDPARSYIVHDASQDDPRTRDYVDRAINSPRGKAVEAALEYARWVANQIKVKQDDCDVVPNGLASMDEVRKMLEWQIAHENRTMEALAIIGFSMPVLNWIDKDWLQANADQIFDLPEIERSPHNAAGWAAWNAFLVWIGPHIDFYRRFKSQYAYAVQQCTNVSLAERERHHPMNHFGEHLMLLFGRGHLGLDDDDGLLRKFLAAADADVRRHALGFVGQTLERNEGIPPAVVERFMSLWDFYWQDIGRQDAEQRPDAWLFGPWFTSEAFPDDWALLRLEEFVQIAGVAEPDHDVAERLASLAPGNPLRSVRILEHMVRKDREGWKVYSWRDSAIEILRLAISAGGEAGGIAVRLIDYLGRQGFVELGALLPR